MSKIQTEDLEYALRLIDEMGKCRAKRRRQEPNENDECLPTLISERPEPRLVREEPIPEPSSIRPEPKAVEADGRARKSTVTGIPNEPDPEAIELIRLFYRLGHRDRKELLLLARIKVELCRSL